jgi:hypothetical protein
MQQRKIFKRYSPADFADTYADIRRKISDDLRYQREYF